MKKQLMIAAAVAAVVGLGAPAVTNASSGLDTIDAGAGYSSYGENGEASSLGIRLLSQDRLENLGLGAQAMNRDEDGNQSSVGTMVESTDNLENVTGNVHSERVDEDGDYSSTNVGAGTQDNLDNVDVNANHMNHNDEQTTNFGVNFSFDN